MDERTALKNLLTEAEELFASRPPFDDYAIGVPGWLARVNAWREKCRVVLATYPDPEAAAAAMAAVMTPPVPVVPGPPAAPVTVARKGPGWLDWTKGALEGMPRRRSR